MVKLYYIYNCKSMELHTLVLGVDWYLHLNCSNTFLAWSAIKSSGELPIAYEPLLVTIHCSVATIIIVYI